MIRTTTFWLALGIFLAAPLAARAEIYKRWQLDYRHESPKFHTYVDSGGDRRIFWYMISHVTNPEDRDAPLRLDLDILTDTGRYYQAGFYPIIEDQIIVREEKLDGYALGLQKDLIAEIKESGRYLNPLDLRTRGTIGPGQTFTILSVFPEPDPNLDAFQVRVSGLKDVVKYRWERRLADADDRKKAIHYEYENEMLVLLYTMPGDEYYRHLDTPEYLGRRWIRQNLGPVSEVDTVGQLVNALGSEDPILREVAEGLLARLTPVTDDFGYDSGLDVSANDRAIREWKLWWFRNRERLQYSLEENRFVIQDLPNE